MTTLLEEMRKRSPRFFRVDHRRNRKPKKIIIEDDPFSCSNCVVRDRRSPEHCDRCMSNPDAERLRKVGLL